MIAAVVRELIAAGVTGEALVQAIERIEAAVSVLGHPRTSSDEMVERRREYDRERRRRERNSPPEAPLVSTGHPRTSADSADSALSYLLPSSLPEPIKKGKEERKTRARGENLSADWSPSESHFLKGAELGLARPQIEGMAEDMRLWAQANGNREVARKADWNATFHGWMRRNIHQSSKGKLNGHRSEEHSLVAAGRKRIAELDAIIAEEDRAAERGEPEGPDSLRFGFSPLRLLSPGGRGGG